jgi:hypothetical protein
MKQDSHAQCGKCVLELSCTFFPTYQKKVSLWDYHAVCDGIPPRHVPDTTLMQPHGESW